MEGLIGTRQRKDSPWKDNDIQAAGDVAVGNLVLGALAVARADGG
jgi:hypothetical protein